MKSKRLARINDVIAMYYSYLYQKTIGVKHQGNRTAQSKKLRDLAKTDQRHFIRAEQLISELGADPREFIIAQFAAFAEHSAAMNKYILPKPHQLYSVAAHVRYAQFKGREDERKQLAEPINQASLPTFYREERRLSGLSRMMRVTVSDVLATKPEEFSREFLKSRGVWEAVREVWRDRQVN